MKEQMYVVVWCNISTRKTGVLTDHLPFDEAASIMKGDIRSYYWYSIQPAPDSITVKVKATPQPKQKPDYRVIGVNVNTGQMVESFISSDLDRCLTLVKVLNEKADHMQIPMVYLVA